MTFGLRLRHRSAVHSRLILALVCYSDGIRISELHVALAKFLLIFGLLFSSIEVPSKVFECREGIAVVLAELSGEDPPILVVATVNGDGVTGTIEVADREFSAEYKVEGLDRTWRFFTDDGQEHGYVFLIQPDGTAAYFDHETSKGEPAHPSQVYFCQERKLEKE